MEYAARSVDRGPTTVRAARHYLCQEDASQMAKVTDLPSSYDDHFEGGDRCSPASGGAAIEPFDGRHTGGGDAEFACDQEHVGARSAALAIELDEAKNALVAKEREIASLRHAVAEVEAKAAASRQQILREQQAQQQLQTQISSLKGGVARLEGLSATQRKESVELRHELDRANAALEKQADALLADRKVLRRLAEQSSVMSIRHAVIAQIVGAERRARIRAGQSPIGLYFDRGAIRSASPPVAAEYRLSWSERRDVEYSGLFDHKWYLSQNPDVEARGIDPLKHFIRHGVAEERDPHPLFSTAWYRAHHRDELHGRPPFLHYLRNRANSTHPLFNARYYQSANKDFVRNVDDPLQHFLKHGAREHRNPHPLVSVPRLAAQAGFEESENPLIDYLLNPDLHLASPHPLFDAEFYLSENEDVSRQNINPLLHYCAIGWRLGRQPHRLFPGDWYLVNNADVFVQQQNPLEHFIRCGAAEERSPHPLFDMRFYNACRPDARRSDFDALSHYVLVGSKEQTETTQKLKVDAMRRVVPTAYWNRFDPISAFIYFGQSSDSVPSHYSDADFDLNTSSAASWPPIPDPVYWLPQALRDYIIDRYGEAPIPLYLYLMAVVERFGDASEAFAESEDFHALRSRLQKLAKGGPKRRKPVDVSIVVPVYNNLVFTLTCVLTVLENTSRYSYEIIIGDDGSTDATHKVFSQLSGSIRVIRHAENLGFLGNCNTCAASAKGRFIVFLNNDTLTFPGWLDHLIGPMDEDEHIGLTGSKLLNGDGSLQEGGGIFWRDGSAWNFGRNSDPRLPEFNYVKDVDYISGASIALPTSLWKKLEGFDPIFTPAYCEDADIAFRVRDAGFRAIYVPHSELVHHEGKSHGRDTSGGVKAYQVTNLQKLHERWRTTLEADHYANGQEVFLARDRSRHKPHILFVDHYIPQWDRDAGSRCMYQYIRMFISSGFHVTFWPDNLNEDREYCAHLQKMGVEVIFSAAYVDRFEAFMAANGRYFDYALLSRPHIAIKYYDAIRAHSRCNVLYWGVDLHFARMELELATNNSPDLKRSIEETRALETENWNRADINLYPSVEEREEVRKLAPRRRTEQVPLYGYTAAELEFARANLAHYDGRNPDDLIFVGGTHPPNVDALVWFANKVLPIVLTERPDTKLHIVGSAVSPEVARLESDAIIVRGRLSDPELAELYKTAGVAVIPLRFGGGVKGKTIEALLSAIPFVTTPVGLQGLAPEAPICFVASDTEAFAQAVVRAQTEREEARANVLRGLDYLERTYSIDELRRAFGLFIPELIECGEKIEASAKAASG